MVFTNVVLVCTIQTGMCMGRNKGMREHTQLMCRGGNTTVAHRI